MPAVTQEKVRLTGELTAYRAVGSDGWGIGALATDAGTVGITGKLVGVRVGSSIEVEGVWAEHPKYGRQLRVQHCTSVVPQSDEGTVAWLVSTLPQLGANRARLLIERFGKDLWPTIKQTPHALTQISGITAERAEAIRSAYLQHEAERDQMIQLRGWGLTDAQVARCVAKWHSLENVIEHLRANPYELAECVQGFGFTRADQVAMRAGVKFDSPARVAAGVKHVLDECSQDGHCYQRIGEVVRRSCALLGVERSNVGAALRAALADRHAVRRGPRLYTFRADAAENDCAVQLMRLMGGAA